jgi:hypothetical protein
MAKLGPTTEQRASTERSASAQLPPPAPEQPPAGSSHDVRHDVSLGFATRVAETHALTHICESRDLPRREISRLTFIYIPGYYDI